MWVNCIVSDGMRFCLTKLAPRIRFVISDSVCGAGGRLLRRSAKTRLVCLYAEIECLGIVFNLLISLSDGESMN